jgi:hypothetical protein
MVRMNDKIKWVKYPLDMTNKRGICFLKVTEKKRKEKDYTYMGAVL